MKHFYKWTDYAFIRCGFYGSSKVKREISIQYILRAKGISRYDGNMSAAYLSHILTRNSFAWSLWSTECQLGRRKVTDKNDWLIIFLLAVGVLVCCLICVFASPILKSLCHIFSESSLYIYIYGCGVMMLDRSEDIVGERKVFIDLFDVYFMKCLFAFLKWAIENHLKISLTTHTIFMARSSKGFERIWNSCLKPGFVILFIYWTRICVDL